MKGLKIFYAWLITVIAGSLLPGILVTAYSGVPQYGFGIALLMLAFSSVCSLPTLVTLLVVNATNQDKSFKTCVKRVTLAHVILFLLTIGVGRIFEHNSSIFSPYTLVVIYYAIVGMLTWIFMFMKNWSAETAKERGLTLQANPNQQEIDSDAILK